MALLDQTSWPHPPKEWVPWLPDWSCLGVSDLEDESAFIGELKRLERRGTLCPPLNQLWTAFELTVPADVQVVVLGQDPYHGFRQAHGLAFSVADPLLPWPPSLRNIFKERASDLGVPEREADLSDWARQGVLLLNAVLTTEAGKAGQHQGRGWEEVVKAALHGVMTLQPSLVWVLWGKPAQRLHREIADGLDRPEDVCIAAPHPSPLSAYRGFFGSRPFSQVNAALQAKGRPPIAW